MKSLPFYRDRQLFSSEDVFQYFESTLLKNNRTWEYFINWNKVSTNVEEYKVELNILNSLCGSKDFDQELINLLRRYPEVVKAIPTLIGVREQKLSVLDSNKLPFFDFFDFDFSRACASPDEIYGIVQFFRNSGLRDLIVQKGLTNIRDYAIGIEAGLDTNGRKNRGGTIMESLVDNLLAQVYNLTARDYSTQGSPAEVKRKWDVELPVDKSSRRPDFLIYRNQRLFWIETNFYSGGGSKLKSTCGEYKALFDFCKNHDVTFIWITDGFGWKTTLKPLEETFLHTDYIFNLSMIKDGILRDVF